MGRVFTFLSILIFIDLFFIATGQMCVINEGCSFNSIILNAIIDLKDGVDLQLFTDLIGNASSLFSSDTGLLSGLAGASVLIASAALAWRSPETLVSLGLAAVLALLASDFVIIFSYLFSLNALLGLFFMVPIIIMYFITMIDWFKNKD